jgi:hypothetical protein
MSKTVISAISTCDVELRTINLFVLNKLYLLDEAPAPSVTAIAERLIGLHAKRPQTPYLSVYARNPDFAPSALNTALYTDRSLLRAHCMRGTVHALPSSQYRTVRTATAGQLDGMYRRAFDDLASKQAIEKSVLKAIRQRGPLSHAEIAEALDVQAEERELYLVINELCTREILVKATVNGSWRTSVYNYELLDRWQPAIPAGETDQLKAQSRLLEWYLASYGPSTLADIAWWAGMSQTQVKRAIEAIERPITCVRFAALDADALIFGDDFAKLQNCKSPERAQVKLLPGFDPYVMAYADRGRFISSEYYGKVFRKVSGIIEPVIVVDGWVVGTWKYSLIRGELSYVLFEPMKDAEVNKALNEATKRMANFLLRADAEG